jgi:translocon-associated protein subunit alpha
MDFNYHIQNFSAIAYAKVVKPKQQATVAYSFVPADAFAGRPIGLTINLQYRDAAGNFFIDPVFNETVQIVEFDEGFDTETFFLYVTMAGSVILLLFLGYNFIAGTMYQQIRYRSSLMLLPFEIFFKTVSSGTVVLSV